MPERPKILLLDDDTELLELYQGLLKNLPGKPEVTTCNNGARAIALLNSEHFNLLISDLNMPKMDGLQVLSIVRRRFPDLRIVVMTSMLDEQYRSRAYALGADMYWQKPSNAQEIKLFLDCIESLLEQKETNGFRGIQSKSLVDIIQLECLSQSSTVLKITSGKIEGKIWIVNGEIIDAEMADLKGETAFKKLISLKSGAFEYLPAEPERQRTIFSSYHGLLLDAAQTIDEATAQDTSQLPTDVKPEDDVIRKPVNAISNLPEIEFVLSISEDSSIECRGLEEPEPISEWLKKQLKTWDDFGAFAAIGDLKEILLESHQCYLLVKRDKNKILCAGIKRAVPKEKLPDLSKKIYALWVS